jgi:hypothetical protein
MTDTDPTRRQREIITEIAALGPCLPGSITERTSRCGSPGCACHTDPNRRHGPYPLWTRKVAGKTITRTLSPNQYQTYRRWLDNARRLRELLTELEHLAVVAMARQEGWPEPPPPEPDQRRKPRRTRKPPGEPPT